jgi:hypothetical protein
MKHSLEVAAEELQAVRRELDQVRLERDHYRSCLEAYAGTGEGEQARLCLRRWRGRDA